MSMLRNVLASVLVVALLFPAYGITAFALPDGTNVQNTANGLKLKPEAVGEKNAKNLEGGLDSLELQETRSVGISAAKVVEFVYLDQVVLAIGEKGYIALGLVDASSVITSAKLELLRNDNQERIMCNHSEVADNTVLFSFTFTSNADTASYRIASISCVLESSDEELVIDFLNEGVSYEQYSFEVVTAQLKEALSEMESNDKFPMFIADAKGNLETYNSVVEAIDVVDFTGASEIGITSLVTALVSTVLSTAAVSMAREDYLIVALDPGHGGSDPGTVAYDSGGKVTIREADLNWKIAEACKKELETYTGVSAYLVRGQSENPSLQTRVNRAVAVGADIFVSLHNNSSTGTGTGSEVWYPNDSSFNNETHVVGGQLATEIVVRLAELGLTNRGAKTRDYAGERYPDTSVADYYAVIRYSRLAGIPGIIIEHAFVDNVNDVVFLSDDSNLVKLGVADAEGIAYYYGLVKATDAQSVATVGVRANITGLGWQTTVYDEKTAGTIGKDLGIQAFEIRLQNTVAQSGGIEYRCFFNDAWQGWVSDGQTSGAPGQNTPVQAIQIRLTGSIAMNYDVYYRVYCENLGWLDWAKNGNRAGSVGYNYQMEALQVVVIPKDTVTLRSTDTPYMQQGDNPGKGYGYTLTYQAHVANIGWQSTVEEAQMAGTTGRALAMEALIINLSDQPYSGSITYNAHVANIGWQGWKTASEAAGTTGQSLQMEAIQIELTGQMAERYDIYYRAHCANLGWLDWVKNGEITGTTGRSFSLQAIEIKLVEKILGEPATEAPPAVVEAQAHVAMVGWQNPVSGDATIGTVGVSRAIEALILTVPNQPYTGGITYNAHVANIGWQGWRTAGQTAGTTGQSLQMEAIQIQLTGQMAEKYDIYYRAHCANLGWLDWVKNGETAGTVGQSLRLEALEIKLVQKDSFTPDVRTDETPIMGVSQTTVAQMVRYYNQSGKTYPSSVYAQYGAPTITDFCTILLQEANAEGVRAEVIFAQAMHETGWLQFGGDVLAEQCNFAGIGATGEVPGNSFNDNGTDSVRIGLRAQVQHLKAYASTASLNQTLVDPRFAYVTRACAPMVEDLGGKWAVDAGYGTRLVAQINALLAA